MLNSTEDDGVFPMVELRQGLRRLRVSPTIWTMTLELAVVFRWKPAGTVSPPESASDWSRLPWQTQYAACNGQAVSAQDANGLADGLAVVADDPSGRLVEELMGGQLKAPEGIRTPATGFKWFATDAGREHLRQVIAFARQDGFKIY